MEKTNECITCGNLLTGKKVKYCSNICNAKDYAKNHPDKKKEWNKEGVIRFRENNPDRFRELMRNQYYKHKDKWDSRKRTNLIINLKKHPEPINKLCKICGSPNTSLKFEVYPTLSQDIRNAIKQGKIYYICKIHR